MPFTPSELELAYAYIVKAEKPELVFGDLGEGDIPERLANLEIAYKEQCQNFNPDNYPEERFRYIAQESLNILEQTKAAAESAIKNGTYDQINRADYEGVDFISIFKSGGHTYKVYDKPITGDYCTIFFAKREGPLGVEEVCLKAPLDSRNNDLMANEARTLMSIQHKSLPIILNTLSIDGKQLNVFRRIGGSFDLLTIKRFYPQGLPQEHVAWILDRLLSVLGYMHSNNILHGSIEPGNVMIVPQTHNGLLIDMLLSVQNANQHNARYLGYNSYSAPEILDKTNLVPHPSSDVYSLGKTMFFLLGGNQSTNILPDSIDPRLKGFVLQMCDPDYLRRPSDAWASWHQLRRLRQEIFGRANQFLPLHIGES